MDNIDLQIKKLRGHWTSHQLTVRNSKEVDHLRSQFEKCDKKVKMKILLSFVSMPVPLRASLTPPIKRLLQLASSDNDEWVQIVAGLVDAKLSAVADEDIQLKCKETLTASASRVVKHLLDQVIFDEKDVYEYFEPLLTSFLAPAVEEDHNPHCTYTGSSTGPDFILREQKLLEAKQNEGQKKAGYVTLMHHSNALSMSSQRGQLKQQRAPGTVSGLGGGGAARRGSIKSVSLSQMQEMKAREKEQKEKEKQEALKLKEANLKKEREEKKRKNAEASTTAGKVPKLAADQTASSSTSSADLESTAEGRSEETAGRAVGSSSSLRSDGGESTSQHDKPAVTVATDTTSGRAPAPVQATPTSTPSSATDQVQKILDEIRSSALVSAEDKLEVAKFFRDKAEKQSAEDRATTSSSASSKSVPSVKKIKFKEDEVVDDKGDKKIVRVILELTVNGSSYSYRKIQKTVKTKNK